MNPQLYKKRKAGPPAAWGQVNSAHVTHSSQKAA